MTGKRTVNTTLAMGHQSQPSALLKISNTHMACSTPNTPSNVIILTEEDNYSQDRFPAIQLVAISFAHVSCSSPILQCTPQALQLFTHFSAQI
jgi:hypothetical protein